MLHCHLWLKKHKFNRLIDFLFFTCIIPEAVIFLQWYLQRNYTALKYVLYRRNKILFTDSYTDKGFEHGTTSN